MNIVNLFAAAYSLDLPNILQVLCNKFNLYAALHLMGLCKISETQNIHSPQPLVYKLRFQRPSAFLASKS